MADENLERQEVTGHHIVIYVCFCYNMQELRYKGVRNGKSQTRFKEESI